VDVGGEDVMEGGLPDSEDVAGEACGLGARNIFNNLSCWSHILLISTRDSSGSTADFRADVVWNGVSSRCS
jgi:hypothetical protein